MNSHSLGTPRVLAILPSKLPSAMIYIVRPLSALAKQQKIRFRVAYESLVSLGEIHWGDIIVFCRNMEPDHNWILDEALTLRKLTIYDLDDNFWEVPLNTEYGTYFRDAKHIRQFEHYITHVHMVRVYNQRLLEKASDYCQNVILAKPGIDLSLVPKEHVPRSSGKIRITYITGRGAQDSLIDIFSDDLLRILDTFPNQVEAVFWKDIPPQFIGHPNVKLMPIIVEYDQYVREISSGQFDIGLAPLIPTHFYLCKTDTKFRDYGASRIAGIYSNVEVYANIQHEETGLLVENEKGAWFDAMARLVQDHSLRGHIQETAYQHIREHYRQEFLEQQWEEIIDLVAIRQAPAGGRIPIHKTPAHKPRPAKDRPLMLDLGSEGNTPPGWIGVNRWRYPGVKVIADIHASLPFAADSIDGVSANRSLEDVANLTESIKDIYRICKHGAQVCIVASYTQQGPSVINTLQRPVFNEQTPRLWTSSPDTLVYEKEYLRPDVPQWGLGNSEGIDLRCLKMEFFYTKDFQTLSNEEKRRKRQTVPGACELIVYQLVAIKRPTPKEALQVMADDMNLFEPAEVTIRRLEELNEALKEEYETTRAALRVSEVNLAKSSRTNIELEQAYKSQKEALEGTIAEYAQLLQETKKIAHDLEVQRNRRIFKLIARLFDRTNVTDTIPPLYQQLKDDSYLFHHNLEGYLLQPSQNLQQVPFLSYFFEINRSNLCQIMIAPILDVTASNGTLGIEIVSPHNQVVAQTVLPANEVKLYEPASFQFPVLHDTHQGTFELRVLAREVDVPVRIYEWRKYPPLGLGQISVKAFCSFGFAGD